MISQENYQALKEKYGQCGSWTVWAAPGETPKSNTNDMSWVNDPQLLSMLDTGFIFVGLNWSSTHGDISAGGTIDWANFHSGYSRQNDYKLRYALMGTRYWGSYITDLLKFYSEVDSNKVGAYIRKNPRFVEENIEAFEREIGYLKKDPVLVALGGKSYELLCNYLGNRYRIAQIKHYSYTIGKEDYREEVLRELSKYSG